jgi:hypothetical protein
MSPHKKFCCYFCEKIFGGRKLGSSIGSGKFINHICIKCTEENYVWDHNLVPDHTEIARRYKELQRA